MGVYKHKQTNKWYCQGMVNGTRYHKPCSGANTKAEAKAIEDALRLELRKAQLGLVKVCCNYTFKDMFNRYINVCKANNKSIKSSIIYANYFLNYFGEKTLIKDIKPSDIETFKLHMIERGKANATINRYLSAIKRAYNIMCNDGLIDFNPTRKVKKLTEDNRRHRYLTKAEWERLKRALPFVIQCIVICALQTGLRKENVLKLRWEQVDLNLRVIEIVSTDNKGKKRILLPITNTLYDVFMLLEPRSEGYIFLNPETDMPYNDIRKSFYRALKEAGINDFKFHDLRRTVGTWLLEEGVDVVTIQHLLGHKDISTTQRYLSLIPEQNKRAFDILNKFM